ALLAGGQTVKSHFATLPTSWKELNSGKVHHVITSYAVLGGRHSTVAMYTTEAWKNDNPKLYECVWTSFRTAIENYRRTAERAGFEEAGVMAFPDHHDYTAADVEEARSRARAAGAEGILTTEKDAVKLRPLLREGRPPWWSLRIRLTLLAGEPHWLRWASGPR
ncbi:MAG: tetraacyldisaccharide 4'-kinase, partial [Nitrospinota bacterium]